MTAAQWDRLKTAFQGALEQPPAARRAWLRDACAGDDEVLREAEALLDSHETAGTFLETPAAIDAGDVETYLPGEKLGAYTIVEEVGRGGMGIVYLAEDTRLGRRVALKALPAIVSSSPDLRERLRREARAAATVSHPAVATVHALEEIDGQLFVVSEYVAGETLRDLIARGPVGPARGRTIAMAIAGALAAAHDAGVIHRDLKPENVLLSATGAVKVVDFGIALVEGPAASRLTRTGAMLGTPAYMAPEQLLGTAIDARADLYSLGVLVREMITGVHPLAPRSEVRTPPPQSAAAGALLRIAARCMNADPEARYRSAHALLAALEAAAADPDGAPAADQTARGASPVWWWEFHQAVTALLYWLMMIPAWQARGVIGGGWGRAFFFVTLAAVIVAANLRLHLWFTSRFYPAERRWARRRVKRWVGAGDWTLSGALVSAGLLIGDKDSPLAILLISFGIGAAVAFLLIEPVTTRAAFKTMATPPR
jgi:hypothetical protein